MSLFEKLKNKRYDLQEAPIDDKGNITPEPGEIKKSERIVKKFIKKQKKVEQKNIKTNTQKGDQLLQDINKRKSADLTRSDAINRAYGTSGSSTEGSAGANTGTTQTNKPKVTTGKGVDQADVSKQAKDFTKKINKERVVKQGNIFGGQDKVKPKTRVGSNTPRGTRTVKKKIITPGQKRLNLGDYTKGKVQTTKKLSKSGEVLDDLRTVKKKYPRGERPKMSDAAYKKVVKQASKPEKMVVAPDPVKGGFQKVGATTTTGKKVLKKSISADELIGNEKKIEKKIVKNNKKTNLFSKVKSKLKGFHNYMVKDAGFRKTASKNLTRNTFKNTIAGNTLKNINKVLPGKYKALAALAVGAYVATRGKKKDSGGGAGGGKTPIKPTISRKSINLSKPEKPNA